ncbi:MAG: HAMP domain-containing histidine kinase [Candidatus Oceanisphaera merdipullorum]|nr:HAMP domain-containing histidine kinase [Candidatus Oceanisphaera merdipullorum]
MRLTIKARLQLALNLVIVTTSLLAAAGMVQLVFWFEDTLFYNHLQSDLTDHIHEHQAQLEPLVLPMTDTTYYKLVKNDQQLLPEAFRGYPQGGHEVLLGNKAYNLLVRDELGWIHVLVQDQSEFERYELIMFTGIGIGVLLIWWLGFVLSRRLSQQILKPMAALAQEVAHLPEQPGSHLTGQYPDDETGQLARIFDRYVLRVNELLLREQQFSANASHELRTPMMVIRGALDMLALRDHSPAVTRQLQRIDDALGQMQQQTELFLQLSRTPDSQAGNNALSSLVELAKTQLVDWQPLATSRGLYLRLNTVASGPLVPTSMMVAVLNNLLRNAIQHTLTGGIEVEVTPDYLRVSDSGSGISDELQTSAMERGVSVANPEGFGLGLAIVERICAHQSWRLRLSKQAGGGTQVTVYFTDCAESAG